MAEKMVEAYDTRTGEKLPQRVPAVFLRLFPHLSATPKQKARYAVPAPPKHIEEA